MKLSVGFVLMLALAALLLPAAVFARPVSDDAILTLNGEVKAGITPDSPLHFLDRFFDGLSLSLASGHERKAEKAMEIARERLMESKAMIEKDNLGAAQRAQRGHSSALAVVDDSIRKIRGRGGSSGAEFEGEIERELKEHEHEVEDVRGKLEAKISDLGEHGLVIALLKSRVGEVEFEIEMQKEDNVVRSSGRFEERSSVRAFVSGDSSQARVEIEFSTPINDLKFAIDELLSKLKMSGSDVVAALDVENEMEELKDELRTDIESRNGIMTVKFRTDFPVKATSREAIAEAIAGRLASITAVELGESVRAVIREDELRGREAEPGEDVRGNADENEVRGREAEARGREAEGEAPRGMDDASDFDSTPGSRGGGSDDSSGSGRGGGSSDD